MVFSSIPFICFFLPFVLAADYLIKPIKYKNCLLTVVSVFFYAYGEPVYVLLMLASSFGNYLFGRMLAASRYKKIWLSAAVFLNLAVLTVFKYAGFLVTCINTFLPAPLPVPQITLPIGISFFTFQAMSYVIDVYRDNSIVQKNYGKILLYISFFPQLIAGPIVKYHDIDQELTSRQQSADMMVRGIRRFVIGLSKKVLIANSMAMIADYVFALSLSRINFLVGWLGAFAYLFQIYYDFSGYSDMAIGLALMFGFHFKENFNYPYISTGIKEFWRRWHISLSTWFKEYLYIPLGGNRKGRRRTTVNKMIVFLATGIWHGANWTFVVWGMLHGAFLILEDYVKIPENVEKMRPVRALEHIYTLFVITTTFVIFRADTIGYGFGFLGRMLSRFSFAPAAVGDACYMLTPVAVLTFFAAILFAMPVQKLGHLTGEKLHAAGHYAVYALVPVLLAADMLTLASSAYNPFIYFKF